MLTDDKWADLPTIQCHPTMSDEDREFDSDLAYMRDLVTELHVHGSVEHLAGILDAPMAEWDIDLYLEPWPTGMDLAGDMLAAWRSSPGCASPTPAVIWISCWGESAELIHTDEHGANAMGPGTYVVRGKREEADAIRRVAD